VEKNNNEDSHNAPSSSSGASDGTRGGGGLPTPHVIGAQVGHMIRVGVELPAHHSKISCPVLKHARISLHPPHRGECSSRRAHGEYILHIVIVLGCPDTIAQCPFASGIKKNLARARAKAATRGEGDGT
jgi:hypothetical protein